jgi:flagellar protein FliL
MKQPLKTGFFRRAKSGTSEERGAWFGPAVLLTLLSIGAGVGFGVHLVHAVQASDEKAPPKTIVADSSDPLKSRLKKLKPIVTNIGEPDDVWARLEASIVFEDEMPNSEELSAQISQDLLGYMKTMKLTQIEGASHFAHLREDLKDRVQIRSGGEVRDLIIESFVVQ